VPSLRNVALTAPYMHDGRFSTLEEVLDHYSTGVKVSKTLDTLLINKKELGIALSPTDKKNLIQFLNTLTDYTLIKNKDFSNP
jgi:cytochrome c peroxidase